MKFLDDLNLLFGLIISFNGFFDKNHLLTMNNISELKINILLFVLY